MLPMMSYLVTLATDSHHTLQKKCQATENSRCLNKIVLKKIGNNFRRTGIHNLPFVRPTPVKTDKQIQISIRSLREKMNWSTINSLWFLPELDTVHHVHACYAKMKAIAAATQNCFSAKWLHLGKMKSENTFYMGYSVWIFIG